MFIIQNIHYNIYITIPKDPSSTPISNSWLSLSIKNNFNEIETPILTRATPEGARIKVMAQVTERVAKGVAFLPFHFGGHMEGKDLRSKYPEGADPYVLGEAANTAMTYGYDSVTQMQETKCSLCQIELA